MAFASLAGMSGQLEPVFDAARQLHRMADVLAGRKLPSKDSDQPAAPAQMARKPKVDPRLYEHPMFAANGWDMVAGRRIRTEEPPADEQGA